MIARSVRPIWPYTIPGSIPDFLPTEMHPAYCGIPTHDIGIANLIPVQSLIRNRKRLLTFAVMRDRDKALVNEGEQPAGSSVDLVAQM